MTAVKNLLYNLSVYGYAELYLQLFIVLCFLAAAYVFSFIFFGKGYSISTSGRILTGNIVLINIALILLLVHGLSPFIISTVIVGAVLIVCFIKKLTPVYLLYQGQQAVFSFKGHYYLLVLIAGLFMLLLPKAFNGFLRWDEMSYHLAYPQLWINNGGFVFDGSMRYPVYSFGNHVIYTLLLVFGNVITIKLYNGFFLLFLLLGMRTLFNRLRIPKLFAAAFILFLLTLEYFNEWTFTTMLEPILWTYSLFFVIEAVKLSSINVTCIGEGKLKSFLPLLLYATALISIKNFMIVYVLLYLFIVAIVFFTNNRRNLRRLLVWISYAAMVLLIPNLVNIALCFYYSGDPLFPLFTMNFPGRFTTIWDVADVQGLKDSVHEKGTGPLHALFDATLLFRLLIVTIVATGVLLLLLIVKRIKDKSALAAEHLPILLWLIIALLLTQALFPGVSRYSYFLLPTFIYCISLIYLLVERRVVGVALSGCFLLFAIKPAEVVHAIGFYSAPFKKNNIKSLDLERITYGDTSKVTLLQFLHDSKLIDTVRACHLVMYRYLLLKDEKVVIGDDVGKYRFNNICSCSASRSYIVIPKRHAVGFQNCPVIYQNKDFLVYKPQ